MIRPVLSRPLAHRGLHDTAAGRPENSRAAFAAAIDAGYGIELDVQPAGDDVAMVFHDHDLDRLTTETGPIRARDAATLAGIALRGGDEGIPTLREICNLVAGRVPLVVEIKDQDGALGPDIGPLERAVADVLRTYDGPLAVMSFNPHSVMEMARLLPDVPRGLTTCAFAPEDWRLPADTCEKLRAIPDYDQAGACFISHDHRDLQDNPRIRELKRQGAAICCWTIRSAAEEIAARRVADTITFEGYGPATA